MEGEQGHSLSLVASDELMVKSFFSSQGIPGDRKETLRAFLVYFEGAVLKKAQRVRFDFASVSLLRVQQLLIVCRIRSLA